MYGGTGTVTDVQLCRAIEQLRGVETARVVMSGDSEVVEVHVVATPERKPKQIVRDIESLLMAQFRMDVDYRKISLAQVQESPVSVRTPRPQLVTAEYADGEQSSVQVVLEESGRLYGGVAEMPADADSSLAPAAIATLDAMHRLIGHPDIFELEDVRKTKLGDKDIVVVLTRARNRGKEEKLIGTCFVRNDILGACARATLDSINRRLFWCFR